MNKKYLSIFIGFFVAAFSLFLFYYYFPASTPKDTKHLAPVAQVAACGDLSLKSEVKPILDAASFSANKIIESSLKENASALPSYVIELLKKNGFEISAVPADQSPSPCSFAVDSPRGRPLLCVNLEKKRLTIVLKKDHDAEDSSDSQINAALLPGVFSLVYDYFWHLQDDHNPNFAISSPGKPIDASEKPLNDYQKFSFWRDRTMASLKLFSNPEWPYLDFEGSGPLSPSYARRGLNLLSNEYYCRPESHQKMAERHPEFYKEFSESLACVLGKPWFMKDEDYLSNCPKTS